MDISELIGKADIEDLRPYSIVMHPSDTITVVCEIGRVVNALKRNHNNVYWCL